MRIATTIIALMILTCSINAQVSFKVRQNSLIGKVAAHLHGTHQYAVTIGRTIYLSCSEEVFLEQTGWVYHELTHITQYQRLGSLEFLKRYFFSMIILWKHDLIPLEIEANYNEDNLVIPKCYF